jgi:xanthine dehydrogenase small subunit
MVIQHLPRIVNTPFFLREPDMASIELTINGQQTTAQIAAHTTLLHWLRDHGLTGCKEGCAEGECGACAVLIAKADQSQAGQTRDNQTRLTSVNACLVLMAGLQGAEIITAEGLGEPGKLHPVQTAMALAGGSQCGYCTPGFVVSMADEYYRPERTGSYQAGSGQAGSGHADSDRTNSGNQHFEIEALSGNLCRCTGYRPIRDAAFSLGIPDANDAFVQRSHQPAPQSPAIKLEADDGSFLRFENLAQTLEVLRQHPTAKLLAGGTDWGVEVNLRHSRSALTLAIDHLPELRGIHWHADHVEIGAALSLSELERQLEARIPLLHDWIPLFASRLIRNSATLGGNIGTASPIGDSPPVLLVLEASVVLASSNNANGIQERVVKLEEFFTGYRKTVRDPHELIRAIRIPLPLAPISAFYKIAKRRMDDISSVAVGITLELEGERVKSIRIGLGGVAATPIRALETEAFLSGKIWNETNVRAAAKIMAQSGTPLDDHRASAAYRTAMLEQTLLKFFFESSTKSMVNA